LIYFSFFFSKTLHILFLPVSSDSRRFSSFSSYHIFPKKSITILFFIREFKVFFQHTPTCISYHKKPH
jgi:hypothetical protein